MKIFQKQVWMNAVATGAGVFCTIALMKSANFWPTTGIAQFAVYFFCFMGLWRFFSFLLWIATLFATSSKLDKSSSW
jgi:hypothetical protein